ncbi:phosphoenolpyruvate synthase regulatory protein [Insulibacter thermoxylanivorax]|uniref:Putative pyruvate, phosphate dikinase regulatory protein n=1 Tax=Insulibacter thermoxylanivorax TaxID=2749268 RepID=A0A916VHI0_9BACL|nr:pyruvate, water dikinase regulatory protein [Insulibacter thermoxylanivorax]GFR38375.1 phosphoenolpyruvate synthase regulatory protein [Insulibacter thermoxylanivorax]
MKQQSHKQPNQPSQERAIFICSDSTGNTAEGVVNATMRQFESVPTIIRRHSNISHEDEIRLIVEEAASMTAFIAYTLVQPDLRECMKQECIRMGVRSVDIMGPMMQAFIDSFNMRPIAKPGLLHRMDEDYFRRIDSVEFAVKYDDGKDKSGLLKADAVLIGVSRTSKTPLSIYLAHKGFKVANLPLVPEMKVPRELYQVEPERIYGLTMDARYILRIRMERLKSMGLSEHAQYARYERIVEELEYADKIMKELGCMVIDVSDKAIEETANIIIDALQKVYNR